MKKFLSIFLAVLLLFSMSVPVFAAEVDDGSSKSALDTSTLGAFLVSLFKAILGNVKSIPAEELLKLPANAMADITTAIFQVLQLFGGLFSSLTGALGGVTA